MQRLLARMRGEEPSKPAPAKVPESRPSTPASSGSQKQPSEATRPQTELRTSNIAERLATATAGPRISGPISTRTIGQESIPTQPFDPENYVPRGMAHEKSRDLAAMRELANNSARSAIQVSARRKYGTAIILKLSISLVGFIAGSTLLLINGLQINVSFIATIACFLVGSIWGFDAISSLRPLLSAATAPVKDADAPAKAPADANNESV